MKQRNTGTYNCITVNLQLYSRREQTFGYLRRGETYPFFSGRTNNDRNFFYKGNFEKKNRDPKSNPNSALSENLYEIVYKMKF